jgi:hypothetical protein
MASHAERRLRDLNIAGIARRADMPIAAKNQKSPMPRASISAPPRLTMP